MRPLFRRALLAIALVAALSPARPLAAQTPPPRDAIIGIWEGNSTCTRAPWNSGCNDEHNAYVFAPTAHPDSLAEHAYKQVSGAWGLMGEETVTYDASRGEWFATFTNSRVSLRISYHVADSVLTGAVTDLRTGQVSRQVSARRAPALKLPAD